MNNTYPIIYYLTVYCIFIIISSLFFNKEFYNLKLKSYFTIIMSIIFFVFLIF